jgi:hypothetical protein
MSGTNGVRVDPPMQPGKVTITEKDAAAEGIAFASTKTHANPALRIVDFIRPNGFPEKAALLEEDAKGNARLRLFGMSGTVIVEGVPYSPTKRRGFWTHLGRYGK